MQKEIIDDKVCSVSLNGEQFILIYESLEAQVREIVVEYVQNNDKPKFHLLIKKSERLIHLSDVIAQLRNTHMKEPFVLANYHAINEARCLFDRRLKIKK